MSKINKIRTSKKVAKIASKKLLDKRTSSKVKKISASALANRARKTR